LTAYLGQPSVAKRPGQSPVMQHAGDVELFNYYDCMLCREHLSELVESVPSEVGCPNMNSGQSPPSQLPTLRPRSAAGKLPIESAELP
jgi:hypothetical protein